MSERVVLGEFERRVLGVLMEKALAQPEYYPMTLNALVAACNQKQNRNPVMSLGEDTIYEALERLRERHMVTLVFPAPGARTNRYKHEVDKVFGWQPRERAVVAELLLRGPQTAGELRTHCSRLMPFESLDAVSLVVDCLANYDPPVVMSLPREPGRSAIRITHRLYPDDEQPAADVSGVTVTTPASKPAVTAVAQTSAAAPDWVSRIEALEQRVAALERLANQHQETTNE